METVLVPEPDPPVPDYGTESRRLMEEALQIIEELGHTQASVSKDDILDAYELRCEAQGMTRAERRQATDRFDFPCRDAIGTAVATKRWEFGPGRLLQRVKGTR